MKTNNNTNTAMRGTTTAKYHIVLRGRNNELVSWKGYEDGDTAFCAFTKLSDFLINTTEGDSHWALKPTLPIRTETRSAFAGQRPNSFWRFFSGTPDSCPICSTISLVGKSLDNPTHTEPDRHRPWRFFFFSRRRRRQP